MVARATRDAVSGIRAEAKVPRSVSGSEPASNGPSESPIERQGTDVGDGGQRLAGIAESQRGVDPSGQQRASGHEER